MQEYQQKTRKDLVYTNMLQIKKKNNKNPNNPTEDVFLLWGSNAVMQTNDIGHRANSIHMELTHRVSIR